MKKELKKRRVRHEYEPKAVSLEKRLKQAEWHIKSLHVKIDKIQNGAILVRHRDDLALWYDKYTLLLDTVKSSAAVG